MSAVDLGTFEGKPVLAVGIEFPSAGGGLNDALAVDPALWHVGDDGTFILKGPCKKIRYEPIKDTDGLRRVHVFGVEAATVDADDIAAEALAAQAARIAESKKGPLDIELARDELQAAHDEGEHDKPTTLKLANGEEIRCPACYPAAE